LKNIIEFGKLIRGFFSAYFLLKKFKTSFIFFKGGFVTIPFIFWAKALRIPYFIHESDISMGLSNIIATKKAEKIFVGFPIENYPDLPKKKLQFVGQILKIDLKKQTQNFDFGFRVEKPIILITGGSQGATIINKAVFDVLPELLSVYNIIHQTGFASFGQAIEMRDKLSESMKSSYFAADFLDSRGGIDRMVSAIKQSDLVVTRASATTIAEVAYFQKPMIMIPYKYASKDHQTKNAQVFAKSNTAKIIRDDDLTGILLENTIDSLFSDKKELSKLAENIAKIFPANGLETVCEAILDKIK
jgi:UDP-N-acetylglucosamine--N-acetylmuramyl-(pentapeptide) pyrophosphoryl-undecaprenol N-acetylglucosamine transferase